ncbi:MAG: FAD-dependent oxidoreductase [Firmicutes bacterium]|nr:FAD-dependent oxidoreductase [Bacillota bacterium]
MKVVIIGGVAGGATAAARIRRLDENADIVVFEKTGYISYANCGLPYYIGGVIEDEAELTLQTPASFWKRFRIDMRVNHEVIKIDSDRKTVEVRNLISGDVFEESYDKLLISTGASPVKPELPGMDDERFLSLRTVEDTFKIRKYVDDNKPKSAVIIGGGFIGVEVAENLREMGMDVTIVQRPDQLMNPFDRDMASFIHGEMRRHGVELKLGRNVEGFERSAVGKEDSGYEMIKVLLDDGSYINTDMVVLAIGVVPDSQLAKEAGLETGIKGSIVVNDRMETSKPDIYAVGDAVEVKHFITGQKALISLAGPANKQGRIAADNICGGDSVFKGSQGSSVIKIFDMTAASTGINEKTAKAQGIDYDKVYLAPMSHAGYYPGGSLMSMKVIFEKGTYKLLGAQITGYEGVDKRIDVLATAMHAGLSALCLKDLDLAYAPPYSSAKDPVNMAGFMIDNIAEGRLKQFFWDEADSLPRDGSVVLLDCRTPEEYSYGHMEGFINIPVDELRSRIDELPKGKPVYVHCQSGLRSYIACRILEGNGFDCYNLSGGYRLYEAVKSDKAAAKRAMPCGLEKQ